MNEEQWDACTEPTAMLEALKAGVAVSDRKYRLWSVACHRGFWGANTEPCVGRMVDVAESLADRGVSDAERVVAAGGLSPILRGKVMTTIELAGILRINKAFTETTGYDSGDRGSNAAPAQLGPPRRRFFSIDVGNHPPYRRMAGRIMGPAQKWRSLSKMAHHHCSEGR